MSLEELDLGRSSRIVVPLPRRPSPSSRAADAVRTSARPPRGASLVLVRTIVYPVSRYNVLRRSQWLVFVLRVCQSTDYRWALL